MNSVLCILLLMGALGFIIPDVMFVMADTYAQDQICLPCDDVLLHPGDHLPFVKRSNMNSSVCCLTNSKDIDIFMQQVVKTVTSRLTPEHRPIHDCKSPYAEVLPMIKLVGHAKTTQGLDQHTVEWDVASEMTIQHDVDYVEGRIRIATQGTYFIYSSVTFRSDSDNKDNGPPGASRFHRMIKQKDLGGQETVIDQHIFPNCRTSASQTITTSRLEAVIRLNKGDNIYVMVHNTSDILPAAPASNYFGAHII